jgi:hypothetical protein
MLRRGDSVPHFAVTTIAGEPFSYSTIWQRKNLVLVTLPAMPVDWSATYGDELSARSQEFRTHDGELVVTRESIAGVDAGVLVADKWGEVAFTASAESDPSALPPATELLDWLDYVRRRCPECEGEAK